jgi:hypothetical protein
MLDSEGQVILKKAKTFLNTMGFLPIPKQYKGDIENFLKSIIRFLEKQ